MKRRKLSKCGRFFVNISLQRCSHCAGDLSATSLSPFGLNYWRSDKKVCSQRLLGPARLGSLLTHWLPLVYVIVHELVVKMWLGFVVAVLCGVFSAVQVMFRRKIPVNISSGIFGAS